MSDFASSLPVRTENAGDVISKIADKTTPANQLKVNADGSISIDDNSASLTVDASDLDIRDLTSVSDSVEVLQSTHDDLNANANLQVGNTDVANGNPVPVSDAGGSLTVDALDLDIRDLTSVSDSVEVLQSTHDDLNANANLQVGNTDVANGNPVPVSDANGSLTVDATDLDIRDLAFATDKVDASGSTLGANSGVDIGDVTINNAAGASAVNVQDGGNSLTVDAIDLDIRDLTHVSDSVRVGDGTDFLAVNTDGSINVVVSNDIPGNEICNYQTSASVAANASVNHDYTVTALNTFTGEQVVVSGSGKLKAEVLFNGVTKFVAFNSTANPVIIIPLLRTIKAAAGQVIRITVTNRDNQAQDLYSTLMGVENL